MPKASVRDRPVPQAIQDDPIALFESARARIAESTKDMTDEEREELAEIWTEAVNERIRERVRRLREGEAL
jgi:hypothetical protein